MKVVYVIAAAAPPVLELVDLLDALRSEGWAPCVILTPTAALWVDRDELSRRTRFPVRVEPRRPSEKDPLPKADAVLAVPLTFNSLNKWGQGISDTLALGLLNEALGLDVPVVAVPIVKQALRQHPAYVRNLADLTGVGVRFLDPDEVTVRREDGTVSAAWGLVVDALGRSFSRP